MLEPTTKRITATLTEWHGTHGKALGDDGTIYNLHQNQSTLTEWQNGDRIEIYLDLDEQAQIANLTFNLVPYVMLGETLLHRIQGEKFYFQAAKPLWQNTRAHLIAIAIQVVIFLVSFSWFALLMIGLSIVVLMLNLRDFDETDNLAFIFNETGLLIAVSAIMERDAIHPRHKFKDLGIVFIEWDDVFTVVKNKKGYLRCVINRLLIKRSVYDNKEEIPTKYTQQDKYDVWLDIRTDFLSKDQQIRLENAIQHEMTRRGKVFRQA